MVTVKVTNLENRWLPIGRGLPEATWRRRHAGILILLWVHAVGLVAFGVIRGVGLLHAVAEGGIVAALAAIAAYPGLSMRVRSAAATVGLVTSSAVLVHLSGGVIEAHFHFFAMVGIITLYQDWVPFGLAIAFVAVHHGVAGTLDRDSVYNHYAALNNPWKWAVIHGLFVLGASAASVYAWRMNEDAAAEAEGYRFKLEEAQRRRHSALQINDDIVQGLAVVTSALALGRQDLAGQAADQTLAAARAIITDLLGDDPTPTPGSLRRSTTAADTC
jgi:hypothetical protein